MQKVDQLIRTKLRQPFTRPELVLRPRLQEQIARGLRGPLTLITAPAGFGKTTLVASCIAGCGMPVTWLSLDKNDNQTERFLDYLAAALQETDPTIGSEARQLLAGSTPTLSEVVLTSLINDLDRANSAIALVLDDYQSISSQIVHEAVTFLLEHCPKTFHLLIATRSDPPLPLARLRARGQTVELRAADLRFTEPEATQFLNEIMGLGLDTRSVAALTERTEGWIAGLQMAALSMQGRQDVPGFIEGFSGTNRYILDYLLEEVLASQTPEIQHFLLYTSILERLTAPLCDFLLAMDDKPRLSLEGELAPQSLSASKSASVLEYLERVNLFLVPLDDKRRWYRYHHLFADLLHTQLNKSLRDQGLEELHLRASEWYEQNGLTLDAIHHASLASDFERIERLIEQNYIEMSNQGEMFWIRYWLGKLSKELVYRRPWLCLYEALHHSWFGQLDEADLFLDEAKKRIGTDIESDEARSMLAYHDYIKSRVTAMQGDTRQAIELCRAALDNTPVDKKGFQIDINITLGYEYFLYGDFINAKKILYKEIQLGYPFRAINNPVAAYCILARLYGYQGELHKAYDLLQKAAQLIHESDHHSLGVTGLIEVEKANLLYEWNDLEAAQAHLKQGLKLLPYWGKADDTVLANVILARIHLARANLIDANEIVEKMIQLVQTNGVFSEARQAVEFIKVRFWLTQGNIDAASHWAASLPAFSNANDPFGFENEPTHITRARVLIAQNELDEAISLLSHLEKSARSAGRMGQVLEILLLRALALQELGDSTQAFLSLAEVLKLAEPEGYVRIFLDEGQPMQMLLSQWLAHEKAPGPTPTSRNPIRDYAVYLLSHFDTEQKMIKTVQENIPSVADFSPKSKQVLVEPLSQRELEVLEHIALGMTNQEIARQLIISPGTVKAHTASIYRKLDVATRTEAVARARQLGLLP
jgi:LuxR family transcriptional regulator, maltose regulon positive regulatory protein